MMLKQLFLAITILLTQSIFSQDKTLGMTSPTHEKYVGKIVFTGDEKNIEKQKENEAGFKTEFNLGEPIFFRVYLKDALLNTLRPLSKAFSKSANKTTFESASKFTLKVFLDGKFLDSLPSANLKSDEFDLESKMTWTTFRGALKSSDGSTYIGTLIYKEILWNYNRLLVTGKHKLKIEVYPSCSSLGNDGKTIEGTMMASGEIVLNVNGNIEDKNDPNICMPKSLMSDTELEKSISSLYLKEKKSPALSVKITSPKWEIIQNKYTGRPTSRKVDVVIAYKEGNICFKQSYFVTQQYDGSGYTKDVALGIYMPYPKEISCKCLETK